MRESPVEPWVCLCPHSITRASSRELAGQLVVLSTSLTGRAAGHKLTVILAVPRWHTLHNICSCTWLGCGDVTVLVITTSAQTCLCVTPLVMSLCNCCVIVCACTSMIQRASLDGTISKQHRLSYVSLLYRTFRHVGDQHLVYRTSRHVADQRPDQLQEH